MSVLDQITNLLNKHHAQLVAVSKTYSPDRIKEIYDRGQRVFGENRVQEILEKKDLLPGDIQWHLIGHLQRNKVKYIAPFISLIHSVDSERLLREINRQAERSNRTIDILLQVFIAEEDTKHGLDEQELFALSETISQGEFQNIQCRGLMGMATYTENEDRVRAEFRKLKKIFDSLKKEYFNQSNFDTLSMGMSGDYKIALEEGSNMVRIGSLIFGKRN